MKWLTLILSAWVMVLSVVPCCEATHRQASPTEQTAQSDGDCSDDERDETCSPFCSCSTCPGFVSTTLPGMPSVHSELWINPGQVCRLLRPISVVLPVWQPPQLI